MRADEEWGASVPEHNNGNKLFWKEVNGVRKKNEDMEAKVKDENGAIVVKEKV